jgi:hypothetical protein
MTDKYYPYTKGKRDEIFYSFSDIQDKTKKFLCCARKYLSRLKRKVDDHYRIV